MGSKIEVVERKTKRVVHVVDCGDKTAEGVERVERGMLINMNTAEFFTRVVTTKPTAKR